MLVLSRKAGEKIDVAEGSVIVTVLEIRGNVVRIGIEAAADIPIVRSELIQKLEGPK